MDKPISAFLRKLLIAGVLRRGVLCCREGSEAVVRALAVRLTGQATLSLAVRLLSDADAGWLQFKLQQAFVVPPDW